jgi:hypothetical protein
MATYQPPKKNIAYITYVSLVDQSNTKLMKSNPTIASGDFKVSIDGGALANLGTLPTVTPASGVMVKISLSTSEMNGDNITVVCSDAAGAEWCDLVMNLQTSARQVDDLAYPATSGRSLVVDTSGLVDANTVKLGPTGSGTAQTARDIGAGVIAATVSDKTGYTVSTVSDKTGYSLSSGGIQAIWDALTSALTTVGSIGKLLVDNINATISSRSTYAGADTSGTTTLLSRIASALTLTGGAVTVGTNNDKTGYALTITPATSTDVLTQVNVALDAAGTELSSVPSTTGSIRQKLGFLFQFFRNKKTITASVETIYKEDAATTLGTASVSDDGTTFTRGELN